MTRGCDHLFSLILDPESKISPSMNPVTEEQPFRISGSQGFPQRKGFTTDSGIRTLRYEVPLEPYSPWAEIMIHPTMEFGTANRLRP